MLLVFHFFCWISPFSCRSSSHTDTRAKTIFSTRTTQITENNTKPEISKIIMMQHSIQTHYYTMLIFTSILYTFSGKWWLFAPFLFDCSPGKKECLVIYVVFEYILCCVRAAIHTVKFSNAYHVVLYRKFYLKLWIFLLSQKLTEILKFKYFKLFAQFWDWIVV